jgi:hypothetical protein
VRYQAYGLTLASDTPLPELGVGPRGEPDPTAHLRVRLAGGPPRRPAPARWFMSWTHPAGGRWLDCARDAGGYLLRFSALADFSVDVGGRDIVCRARRGTPLATLRHLLLDQVLPLVLNLRGRDALHATCVLTPGGACAFTGPTGAGKSTLAASFLLAGYPVLSDDCLVLGEDGEAILATPAYPGLRLWGDALAALGGARAPSRPVAHYTSKRRLRARERRTPRLAARHPLARVYALAPPAAGERGAPAAPRLERLSRREGLVELIAAAFRLDIADRGMLARQFGFLARVASRVPVRRLRVPRDFAGLPAVRAAILADLGGG